MPFQLLDIILIAVMIISALLAMMRGFTREVLSLIAWIIAIAAGAYAAFNPDLLALTSNYIHPPAVAQAALGGGIFLIVLIVVSLISIKISDMVVDSSAGYVDRTLGFPFGLLRGLVLVAVLYLIYAAFVPDREKQFVWVRDARSLPLITKTGSVIMSLIPKQLTDQFPAFGAAAAPAAPTTPVPAVNDGAAYNPNQTNGLDQMIGGSTTAPATATPPSPAAGAPPPAPAAGTGTGNAN